VKKLLGSLSVAVALSQLCASAHAPVVPFSFAHGYRAATHGLYNVPVSGSSRAFYTSIKTLTGVTIKNTVLNAPLSNISGQFSGVAYYSVSNATSGTYQNFYNFPSVITFGSNPLNNGYLSSIPVTLTNTANSITTNLLPLKIFPTSFGGHAISGAQRALQGYYNGAATSGYNAGINILQHPTGGLLFGTTYYGGGTSFQSYPGFQAFGNNPFASAAVAGNAFTNLQLPTSTASYIQFGKLFRPITNGLVYSTQYYPTNYLTSFGTPGPGLFYGDGRFIIAIGSNPLNTFLYGTHTTILPMPTYFK
jgi:hypothetical protein